MTKLARRIEKKENSLWVSIFKAKNKFNPALNTLPKPRAIHSPPWKGICNAWPLVDLGSH